MVCVPKHVKGDKMKRVTVRKKSYDYIRVLACFCVIGIHSTGRSNYNFRGGVEIVDFLLQSFSRIGLPVFFLLSGALILNQKNTVHIGQFYLKRFIKIVIPFFIYSLIYVLWVNQGFAFEDCFRLDTWKRVVNEILPGLRGIMETYQVITLWFVYTLLGLYLVAPFIAVMLQNMEEKMLGSLAFFLVVMRCIKNYFPVLFGFKIGVDYIFANWCMYFILGYIIVQPFMEKYYSAIEKTGIAALIISMIVKVFIPQYMCENYYDLAPHMILQAASMFIFIYRREDRIGKNEKVAVAIQKISKYTFSIYLLHSFVMGIVVRSGILEKMTSNIIINEILRIVITFFGGLIIAVVIDNSIIRIIQSICEKMIKLLAEILHKMRKGEHA